MKKLSKLSKNFPILLFMLKLSAFWTLITKDSNFLLFDFASQKKDRKWVWKFDCVWRETFTILPKRFLLKDIGTKKISIVRQIFDIFYFSVW